MTWRYTLLDVYGDDAHNVLENLTFDCLNDHTKLVAFLIEGRGNGKPIIPDLATESEVASYDPDDVLHDVVVGGKHYVLTINETDDDTGPHVSLELVSAERLTFKDAP